MKNKNYILSHDMVLTSSGKRKKLELISSADLKPEYRHQLLESDVFAVFKGASVKILKSKVVGISSESVMSRQALNNKLNQGVE